MLGALIRQLIAGGRRSAEAARLVAEAHQHIEQGAFDHARSLLTRALKLQPHDAAALSLRARAGVLQRRFGEAEADYQAVLALRPDDAGSLLDAARFAYEVNQFDRALELAERALEHDASSLAAHHWHGVMLREFGRYDEAEAAMRRAGAGAGSLEALCGLALVLTDQGRHAEAERALRQALAIDTDCFQARWLLAMLLLLQGRFAEGWTHYSVRLLRSDSSIRPRPLPFWDGGPAPPRPLLVLGEQALGDEILFASCFNDLIAAAGDVIIECDPRLAALFARSFPQATIFGHRDPRAAVFPDVSPAPAAQIAAGSLPALFRPHAEAFPKHRGYLLADASKIGRWRERLDALGPGPKIGLSWRGGTHKTRRALRSIPLRDCELLLARHDVSFVSLQYGEVTDDLAALGAAHGGKIYHWPEAVADLDEMAGLIAALDLVITVQTAAAHLAGALGRPVWIMLPQSPEWRYLAAGSQLPWYPSATLFRQRHVGEWRDVVQAVAAHIDVALEAPARPVLPC